MSLNSWQEDYINFHNSNPVPQNIKLIMKQKQLVLLVKQEMSILTHISHILSGY